MGQMKEVNDVREYDVEVSKKTATAKKKEAGLQLPSALKEGYVVGVTCTAPRAGAQGLVTPGLESLPKAFQKTGERDSSAQSVDHRCEAQEDTETKAHCALCSVSQAAPEEWTYQRQAVIRDAAAAAWLDLGTDPGPCAQTQRTNGTRRKKFTPDTPAPPPGAGGDATDRIRPLPRFAWDLVLFL